jgi:hypothetical protein
MLVHGKEIKEEGSREEKGWGVREREGERERERVVRVGDQRGGVKEIQGGGHTFIFLSSW